MPDGIRGGTNRGSTLISHSKVGNGASRGASISPALPDTHSPVTPWARSQPVTLSLWRVTRWVPFPFLTQFNCSSILLCSGENVSRRSTVANHRLTCYYGTGIPQLLHKRRYLMALISCPECGKEVSDQALACIHCGYPLQSFPPPSGPLGSTRSCSPVWAHTRISRPLCTVSPRSWASLRRMRKPCWNGPRRCWSLT